MEIGDIENDIEKDSNNIIKLSNPLPILSKKQIDKESVEITNIEYCIEKKSEISKIPNSLPILSEEQAHEQSFKIRDIENCIEEYSNNMSKISNALPKFSDKKLDENSTARGKMKIAQKKIQIICIKCKERNILVV